MLAAALALSIGMLISEPDVVAGRQLPGIAIAVFAAVLLLVASYRFSRTTVVAIGLLNIVTLTLTSSPVALRPLLAVAFFPTRAPKRWSFRDLVWVVHRNRGRERRGAG